VRAGERSRRLRGLPAAPTLAQFCAKVLFLDIIRVFVEQFIGDERRRSD
jgi:hypothetical protein